MRWLCIFRWWDGSISEGLVSLEQMNSLLLKVWNDNDFHGCCLSFEDVAA